MELDILALCRKPFLQHFVQSWKWALLYGSEDLIFHEGDPVRGPSEGRLHISVGPRTTQNVASQTFTKHKLLPYCPTRGPLVKLVHCSTPYLQEFVEGIATHGSHVYFLFQWSLIHSYIAGNRLYKSFVQGWKRILLQGFVQEFCLRALSYVNEGLIFLRGRVLDRTREIGTVQETVFTRFWSRLEEDFVIRG